jgi:hypothetical protein
MISLAQWRGGSEGMDGLMTERQVNLRKIDGKLDGN